MSRSVYGDSTLHPPAHPNTPGAGDACPPWVLLDSRAYLADHRNHTTAFSKLTDGGTRRDDGKKGVQIQVTFFVAHPPRVSYYCAYLPGLEPSEFAAEPQIIATEANLALLRVVLGPGYNTAVRDAHDYYIYQADGAPDGGPSLTLLPHLDDKLLPHQRHPCYYFRDYEVGLLRYCTTPATTIFTLRRHRTNPYDAYILAALIPRGTRPKQFDLCTFDSETKAWSSRSASLPEDLQQHSEFQHVGSKVITIGGDAGTMGWADLWRGILFCNVRERKSPSPVLHYLPLPEPLADKEKLDSTAMDYRDLAIIHGRIKYVELQVHIRPGSYNRGFYISDGWTVTTWSTTVSNPWEVGWLQNRKLHSSEVSVPATHHGLLPQPTLERLHIGQPTLSLRDDDIVYFMAKVDQRDHKAWVVALDMRNKTLQGVAEFGGAPRTLGINFTYTHSRISDYLNLADPGTEGHRKLRKIPRMDHVARIPTIDYAAMSMQHGRGEEKHQDAAAAAGVEGASLGVEDGDTMDL